MKTETKTSSLSNSKLPAIRKSLVVPSDLYREDPPLSPKGRKNEKDKRSRGGKGEKKGRSQIAGEKGKRKGVKRGTGMDEKVKSSSSRSKKKRTKA